jgi:hypothetical protein
MVVCAHEKGQSICYRYIFNDSCSNTQLACSTVLQSEYKMRSQTTLAKKSVCRESGNWPGVDVTMTIFGDFCQFSAIFSEKIGAFSKKTMLGSNLCEN